MSDEREVGTRGGGSPRRARDYLWDLASRHGEDYVREGVRLLRMLQVAVVLVGVAVVVAASGFVVWLLR